MTPLASDVQAVTEAASNLGALFLLSPRRLHTATGQKLLEAVKLLANRVAEAERLATQAMLDKEAAEKREQDQRELVEKLLDDA